MDTDTIFPVLTNGEKIIDKYRNHSWSKGIKFIVILTNQRLLICSKQAVCCCCYYHSSYTAISLESIHRIDEHHSYSNIPLYSVLWIFWLLATIAGILASVFISKDESMKIIGITLSVIPLLITTIIILACLCCCFDDKCIQLNGTFGSIKILFEKQEARLFEADLSEQITLVKLYNQQPLPSSKYLPTYYLRDETLTIDQQTITSCRF